MTKTFVYIDGLRGPEPQIWYDVHTKVKPLKSFPMTEDDPDSLIYLMEKYPYDETAKG